MTAYDDVPTGTVAALARFGARYEAQLGAPSGDGWIRTDHLLVPDGPELTGLLKHEFDGRGHATEHATALSLMAVYAGRLPATALLLWALHGIVLDVRPENLWLKPAEDAGIEAVAIRSLEPLPGGLATLYDVTLAGHLLPLADELHRRTRAGLRQLRGGVASGTAMAFCAATRETVAADPKVLAEKWAEFVGGAPCGLNALGEVTTVNRGGRDILVYLRNTCCLYYSCADGSGKCCASCCLTPRQDRLANYAAV
ncbi:hypothetical protein [Kribbella deserti]|uniref:Ferric siderophore reductase C-terminal domain-containing protein n=1 Tax=Kribbella deserti TaxID=1926257 RepID=A0ABV6QVL2_9ACTN